MKPDDIRVNTTTDWGYFSIWWPEASTRRTRHLEEEFRQFIEDAIKEKLVRGDKKPGEW